MRIQTSNSLILYPELAAESLKNNESDIFIIWSILKKIDTVGSGIVLLSDILKLCGVYSHMNLVYRIQVPLLFLVK